MCVCSGCSGCCVCVWERERIKYRELKFSTIRLSYRHFSLRSLSHFRSRESCNFAICVCDSYHIVFFSRFLKFNNFAVCFGVVNCIISLVLSISRKSTVIGLINHDITNHVFSNSNCFYWKPFKGWESQWEYRPFSWYAYESNVSLNGHGFETIFNIFTFWVIPTFMLKANNLSINHYPIL